MIQLGMFVDDRSNFPTETRFNLKKINVEWSIMILCVAWITNQLLQGVPYYNGLHVSGEPWI